MAKVCPVMAKMCLLKAKVCPFTAKVCPFRARVCHYLHLYYSTLLFHELQFFLNVDLYVKTNLYGKFDEKIMQLVLLKVKKSCYRSVFYLSMFFPVHSITLQKKTVAGGWDIYKRNIPFGVDKSSKGNILTEVQDILPDCSKFVKCYKLYLQILNCYLIEPGVGRISKHRLNVWKFVNKR